MVSKLPACDKTLACEVSGSVLAMKLGLEARAIKVSCVSSVLVLQRTLKPFAVVVQVTVPGVLVLRAR